MPDPRSNTSSVANTKAVLDECARRGIETADLLAAHGISLKIFENMDARIPSRLFVELMRFAVAESGDEAFALRSAENVPWGSFGVVDFLAANAATLGEGLNRLCTYSRLMSEGVHLRYVETEDTARVECDYPGLPIDLEQYVTDFVFSCIATRFNTNEQSIFAIEEVLVRYDRPKIIDSHRRIFRAPIRFNQSLNALVLKKETAHRPILGSNSNLLKIVEKVGDELLARLPARAPNMSERVKRALNDAYHRGTATDMSTIARTVGMSARTLGRRISQEDTTGEQNSFSRIRDALQRDLALEWLRNPTISVGEVGFLLGFSEPSAFHRAFKRWTGATPAHYRSTSLP